MTTNIYTRINLLPVGRTRTW